MRTRYDLMKASIQTDPDDNIAYPDILSINYKKILEGDIWRPFLQVTTDEDFKLKPYLKVWQYYRSVSSNSGDNSFGMAEMDDIILDINNIKHLADMLDEETVYFPDITDLNNFYSNYKKTI